MCKCKFYTFARPLWIGGLAQLVERLHGMQEVIGSNPLSSTLIIKGLRESVNPFLLGGLNMV